MNVINIHPVCSLQCWDLNPQPLKNESAPIITRPGLPPKLGNYQANTPYKV